MDAHILKHHGEKSTHETRNQLVLSLALGLSAFIAFCILRPRWGGLYAARKRQKNEAGSLPDLPNTFFGWIAPLWRITDQQILASAGLDAFAFLSFFKLAIKYLSIILFFSLVVIKPVHDAFPDPDLDNDGGNDNKTQSYLPYYKPPIKRSFDISALHAAYPSIPDHFETDYLWMYLVFAYFFTMLAMHLIISSTKKMIQVRQEYLGSQTTITDRTIRLSGIPNELQSEDKIKDFMEELDIGKVESVTLCRVWKELDDAIVERTGTLRQLEESWTVYLGYRSIERNSETLPITQPPPPGPSIEEDRDEEAGDEGSGLLAANGRSEGVPYGRVRPKMRLRYGRFNLQSKEVDAIDYYEEQLRKTDQKIKELRKKDFPTTPLAFVTMDSVAACQMAVQAVLDPSPQQLLAKLSPAPADVVWPNTYLSRRNRMLRSWGITGLIVPLTIFWSLLFAPIAAALNTGTIRKALPQLADWLNAHATAKSIVNTQLPTLFTSLLNVLAPYLYDWLSNFQGMTSQSDVELSVISKNFFFVFFNFFLVFTILSTTSDFIQRFDDSLRDQTTLALKLAESLQAQLNFFYNYIILQGFGLFPLRLLEIGAVAQYPIGRIGAKTPRDYAELVQPPIFSYGFYLPQTLLIFIICMVYCVLRESWKIVLSGLAYFIIGGFVYKYQLLYAMDHRRHATGRAWIMICDRIIAGLVIFQLTVGGQLALKRAPIRSALVLILLVATVWFAYYYNRTYRPLMQFIALRSVRRAEQHDYPGPDGGDRYQDVPELTEDMARWRYDSETASGRHVDESPATGMRFINPSLISPLEKVWIADKNGARVASGADEDEDEEDGEEEGQEDGSA